jgi:hypothetical protein
VNRSLPRGTREISVRFGFAVRPHPGQPVTVTWYGPDGRRLGPPKAKSDEPEIETFVRTTGKQGLATGKWRCILRVGNVPVRTVIVAIG